MEPTTEYAIAVSGLTVAYDEKPILWDINLKIPKGSLIAILGPNGAGKTTLLKTLLGLKNKISGTITYPCEAFKGLTIREQKKKIAYVPQNNSVDWDFPANVLDVVLMGRYGILGWLKRPKQADKEIAMKMLAAVGMESFAKRQISQLSGGQQQRVFLARALVQEAEIYFMDEPFKGVDIQTEKIIIKLLKDLKKQGKTIVVVHHDLQTVTEYFDQIMLINQKLIAAGSVETVFTEANLMKTYQGITNLFREAI